MPIWGGALAWFADRLPDWAPTAIVIGAAVTLVVWKLPWIVRHIRGAFA